MRSWVGTRSEIFRKSLVHRSKNVRKILILLNFFSYPCSKDIGIQFSYNVIDLVFTFKAVEPLLRFWLQHFLLFIKEFIIR